jgi:hypothetical protein
MWVLRQAPDRRKLVTKCGYRTKYEISDSSFVPPPAFPRAPGRWRTLLRPLLPTAVALSPVASHVVPSETKWPRFRLLFRVHRFVGSCPVLLFFTKS